MAGMIPNKKSLAQIEQEIEALRDKHNQSVDSWLKARLGMDGSPKDCAPTDLNGHKLHLDSD